MKNFFLLIFILIVLAHPPLIYAIALDETRYIEVPRFDSGVYGITNSFIFLPEGVDLDEEVELSATVDKLIMKNKEEYLDHLGLFLEESPSTPTRYIPVSLNKQKTKIVAFIKRTGSYFFAPIVPEDKMELSVSNTSPTIGEEFTISSNPLITNAGEPVWDGFPFEVQTRNGEVVNGLLTEPRHYTVKTNGGKLELRVKALIPGQAMFYVTSRDFGQHAAFGEVLIENIKDTTTFVSPATNVTMKNDAVSWEHSPDPDISAYAIYYRAKGASDWNGRNISEIPAPLLAYPDVNTVTLRLKDYEPFIYEIMVVALDTAGNKSAPSNIAEYQPPVIPYILGEEKTKFSDTQNHWAKEFIEALVQKGIITGYPDGTFRPDQPVNRAELVTLALKAFGHEVESKTTRKPFKDVKTDQWYTPFVSRAKQSAIISGYSDKTFRPEKNVNRAEGLKILLNAAGTLQTDIPEVETSYADVAKESSKNSPWFSAFVYEASKKEIIQGYEQSAAASTGKMLIISKPLWKGMTGSEVQKLQQALQMLGHYQGEITGTYDDQTMKAVYYFQVTSGIVKTPFNPQTNGTLGEKTRQKLNAEQLKQSRSPGGKMFKPENLLTRAETAKILVKMLELKQ